MAKGVMNRSGSGSCTQPEHDGGNNSGDQEPRRPGRPAPKALETGRINRSKKAQPRPRDSPGSLHKWKTPYPPGGKQANTTKARTRKLRPGEQKYKKRNVSQSQYFPKSEGHHNRWNGEWPKKGGKARQGRQCLRPGTEKNPCPVITSKKIAKLDSDNYRQPKRGEIGW